MKSGADPLNPSDYRGISLQSVVMKAFCTVLNNRLSDYLETNNLLAEEQNRFRHDRSCQDHLTVYNLIESRKLSNLQTFVCFINFRKAFDSVCRNILWEKLERSFHIKACFLHILKQMYENVSSCVRVDDDNSDWFTINSGVKCVLVLTLFDMFINDLMKDIQDLNKGIDLGDYKLAALLYADDVAVLGETECDLQCILDTVAASCNKWGLGINPMKTKILHFRPKRKPCSSFCFHLGDSTSNSAHDYKYLGFWLNEFLDMEESISRSLESTNRALS